jgi:hypothetical protein
MTPEQYLEQNPTALIFRHEISKAGQSTAMTRPGNGEGWKYRDTLQIDWTDYTEPHVMIGPDFPQSRKRVVEWGLDHIYPWGPSDDNPRHPELRRCLMAENGDKFAQYGKYIDEPSQELNSEPYQNPIAGKEPELSRFLPDGWAWRDRGWEGGNDWIAYQAEYALLGIRDQPQKWHKHCLLHPSEGGGFQKHTPGDPMPCDKIMIDLIWDDEMIVYEVPYDFSKLDSGGAICIGWRPHYKEQA